MVKARVLPCGVLLVLALLWWQQLAFAALGLCLLLAHLARRHFERPSILLFSNYQVFCEELVPALKSTSARLIVVSSQEAVEKLCKEQGVEFLRFPFCDSLSFARICKEDPEFKREVDLVFEKLKPWDADVLFTCGFPVLPAHAVRLGKLALNWHPSSLPSYRGGLPLQAQILRGEATLQCSCHVLTEGIDRGEVLARGPPLELKPDSTPQSLIRDLAPRVPSLFLDALAVAQGQQQRPAQLPEVPGLPHSFGVLAERLAAGRSNRGVYGRMRLEWMEDTAVDIERACRAFAGSKGLFTDYEGTPYAVTHCEVLQISSHAQPGTILALGFGGFSVATCDGRAVRLRLAGEVAVAVGERLESRSLVSAWLGKPQVDRLLGGRRYE